MLRITHLVDKIINIMIEDIQEINYGSIGANHRKTRSKFKPVKREVSSSLDMSTTIQLSEGDKECRICLDNGSAYDNQLVAPCKCTGSVKFVHDKCLRQWIQKQYTQKNIKGRAEFLKTGIQCQLCKVWLSLAFNFKYVCCQTDKFSNKCKESPATLILFIIFFLLNLGSIGFLAYNTTKNGLNFKNEYLTSMVTIIAFVFLTFTAIVGFAYFVSDYMVERIMVLDGYEQRKAQISRYSRNQIIPQSLEGE